MLKHLLLRLPALNKRSAAMISDHNKMIETQGAILFGKFGAGISHRCAMLVAKQVSEGKDIRLFLAQRSGDNYVGYEAKISSVHSDYRKYCGALKLPDYYPERPASVIALASKLESTSLSNLLLESNERPLLEVLATTRTPVMMVINAENSR